jgi:hypothetical protein
MTEYPLILDPEKLIIDCYGMTCEQNGIYMELLKLVCRDGYVSGSCTKSMKATTNKVNDILKRFFIKKDGENFYRHFELENAWEKLNGFRRKINHEIILEKKRKKIEGKIKQEIDEILTEKPLETLSSSSKDLVINNKLNQEKEKEEKNARADAEKSPLDVQVEALKSDIEVVTAMESYKTTQALGPKGDGKNGYNKPIIPFNKDRLNTQYKYLAEIVLETKPDNKTKTEYAVDILKWTEKEKWQSIVRNKDYSVLIYKEQTNESYKTHREPNSGHNTAGAVDLIKRAFSKPETVPAPNGHTGK